MMGRPHAGCMAGPVLPGGGGGHWICHFLCSCFFRCGQDRFDGIIALKITFDFIFA